MAVSSAVIRVCVAQGRLQQALGVFGQLQREGGRPEVGAFNVLLQGCARAGAREEALHIFHLMRASKVGA